VSEPSQPTRRVSKQAIIAFVASVVGLPFAIGFGLLTIVLGLTAIIIGVVALIRRSQSAVGVGLTIAGILIGGLDILTAVLAAYAM